MARPTKYGEPTRRVMVQMPESLCVALEESGAPSLSEAVVAAVRAGVAVPPAPTSLDARRAGIAKSTRGGIPPQGLNDPRPPLPTLAPTRTGKRHDPTCSCLTCKGTRA